MTHTRSKCWTGNIVAAVTPFNRDGSLDTAAFKENLQLLLDEGIDGFVVLGDTGEFWSVTDQERQTLTELALTVAAGKVPVIVGCSAMTAPQVLEFGRCAKEVGADGIMVTPPFYVRPGEEEIFQFYKMVAGATELPIMLYNIPKRHSVSLPVKLIDRLADVDQIVAIKQSNESFLELMDTIRVAGDRLTVLAGHSVERGYPAVVMGADGYLSSVEPQVMGRSAIDMYRYAKEGRYEEARDVQLRCIGLDHAVHGAVGTFPASLKAAMNAVGRPGGYPRLPLLPVSPEQEAVLKRVLQGLALL